MFLPATWSLPLALSILWPHLLTWNFYIIPDNFVQIPGTVLVATVVIPSGIFVYCFDKYTFPKLLAFLPPLTPQCLQSSNFSYLYCCNVVITFELE